MFNHFTKLTHLYEYIYLNAKVSQPFYIRVSSVWSMWGYFNDHILCSCTMSNDLPFIGFEHAFHSERFKDVSVYQRFASNIGMFISI